jgi:hypothetical protein
MPSRVQWLYAIEQPADVDVNEIIVRPTLEHSNSSHGG